MNKKLIIIKLGGSILTFKDRLGSVNIPIINRMAHEIAIANKDYHLIVIHGGGSFGHPYAYGYFLHEGFKHNHQLKGLLKTHYAMLHLNSIIVNEFQRVGLTPFSFHTSSFITTSNGEIKTINFEPIVNSIKLGFIPILYGDVVFDDKYGFHIVSGDKLCSHLSTLLNPCKVIFCCDVDGIYTADPKRSPHAKLLERINLDEITLLIDASSSLYKFDVTGGMKAKLLEAMKIVSKNIDVLIINAMHPNRLLNAIYESNFYGSKITLK